MSIARELIIVANPGSQSRKYALYAGDDVTDEHVFELNRPDLFTIRVGASTNSAASYQIADHESIIPLMNLLIEYLPHQRNQGYLKS